MIITQQEIAKRFRHICNENNLFQKIATCPDIAELEKLFIKTIAEFAAEYMIDKIMLIHRLIYILKGKCK